MIVASEREKYEEIWAIDAYRAHSPGVQNIDRFLSIVEPRAGASLIDIGCGTGEAGHLLQVAGLDVWWLDITDAALSPEVDRDRFIESALWKNWSDYGTGIDRYWDYGFCCDVMEHIPTEFVMLALDRIVRACGVAYFSIALRPDVFGQAIGQPLHLTVREFAWWRDHLAEVGAVLDARDLCGDGLFVCSRN